jgi:hypothetical protein
LFGKRQTPRAPLVHMRLGSAGAGGAGGVLSVAKLTLGQEAYYEQQVAGGLDDYYAGRGESPGLWVGSGASVLGLAGVVEEGDLGTLLRGVDPAGGARLRAPVRERTITVRTLDAESGEWRGVFEPLRDPAYFALVDVDPEAGTITWPDGLDMAPEPLYNEAGRHPVHATRTSV